MISRMMTTMSIMSTNPDLTDDDPEVDDALQEWIDYIYEHADNFGIVIPEHLTFLNRIYDLLIPSNSYGWCKIELEIVNERLRKGRVKSMSIRKKSDIYPVNNYFKDLRY